MKLRPEELRIGNWIDSAGQHMQVSQILSPDDPRNTEQQAACSPIPLTEEWMIKLGFKKITEKFEHDRWDSRYEKGTKEFKISVTINPKDHSPLMVIWNMGNPEAHITDKHHIHQLQNLYFALTGKELTIK